MIISEFLPAKPNRLRDYAAQMGVRCPFNLDRMVSVSEDGKVVYRAEKTECQPFPMLGDGMLLRGVARNFDVF